MRQHRRLVVGVALGMVLGGALVALAGKVVVDPGLYVGAEPQAAASGLLGLALQRAGKGSWERLAVARVHILGGQRSAGEAIVDEVLAGKSEASDWYRIGQLYAEAGDWERARGYFDRVVEAKPEDEDWLAAIGAWHNLNGDRATAEALFQRSFQLDPESHKNLAIAAGSYVGVAPAR